MRAHLQCSTDPGVASTSYAHLSAAGVCSAPSWRRRRAGPPRGNAARCFAAAAHAPHTAKAALRTAIEYTRRGSLTSKDARGQIEEAQTGGAARPASARGGWGVARRPPSCPMRPRHDPPHNRPSPGALGTARGSGGRGKGCGSRIAAGAVS